MFRPVPQPGYVTLLAVVIIGTIGAVIAAALLESGSDASRMGTALESAALARSQTRLCAERILDTIHYQTSFTGTVLTVTSDGACTTTVADTGSGTRSIRTTSTVADVTRVLNATLSATSPIVISSWQEVP